MTMPIYEYECLKCGEKFERLRRLCDSDEDLQCPVCGTPYPKRAISTFASTGGSNPTCTPLPSGGG